MKFSKTSSLAALILLTVTLAGFISFGQKELSTTEPSTLKHVIFLTGEDLAHASGTHEFYAGAKLLEKSLSEGQFTSSIKCTVLKDWPEDTSIFETADLIVHYYRGNKFHKLNKNFRFINQLVEEKAISQMFIHFAIDPDPATEASIKSWTGGVYNNSSVNPIWDMTAQLTTHPINNGVKQYQTKDEWSLNINFESKPVTSSHGSLKDNKPYPIMNGAKEHIAKDKKFKRIKPSKIGKSPLTIFWAKENKSGSRGIGVTGGHFHKNWANDNFRKQILNAIVWGAKLTVPPQGTKSKKITEDDLNKHMDKKKKKFQRLIL